MIIRNTRKKPLVCRPQSENGIVTPPLPLNAVVAQRGASLGDISEGEKTDKPAVRKSVRKTGKHSGWHYACR